MKISIQAEQLRQIRDNEFKTIEERIQVTMILDVLDKQEKAMLRQVNIQIESTKQYNLNDNPENYIAIRARNEKQAY